MALRARHLAMRTCQREAGLLAVVELPDVPAVRRVALGAILAEAAVETDKGRYSGTGTASAQRDAHLADSLVELPETEAIARALRFGGFGV